MILLSVVLSHIHTSLNRAYYLSGIMMMKKRNKNGQILTCVGVCMQWRKKFEMCSISKTYLFLFSLPRLNIYLYIYVWILSLYWFSWGLHMIIKTPPKKSSVIFMISILISTSSEWGDKLTAWIIIVWK